MPQSIHVVLDKDGWLVTEEDGRRLQGRFYTQNEAVDSAREVAMHSRTQLFVHGRYGEIQQRASYGGENPFQPS